MRKLLVIPGDAKDNWLGGAIVSLSMMIDGFEKLDIGNQLCVVVKSNSIAATYLKDGGHGKCLQEIEAKTVPQFIRKACRWVSHQPIDSPILLENFTAREVLPSLLSMAPALRRGGRDLYHLFRDRGHSKNPLGNLLRWMTFDSLAPYILCNSSYTAASIDGRFGFVDEILYPPIDLKQFRPQQANDVPPAELQSILQSGCKIMLTPSRIASDAETSNNKNLSILLDILAQLKKQGHHYHCVIVGQDTSKDSIKSLLLQQQAKDLGVNDRFTILPPTFNIQNYYRFAHVVVTLAPQEPFGRTVVEAIASGIPVLGSRTGGIGEILNHFAPEWTVSPHDAAEAASRIIRMETSASQKLELAQSWVAKHCNAINYARRIGQLTRLNLVGTSHPYTPFRPNLSSAV